MLETPFLYLGGALNFFIRTIL